MKKQKWMEKMQEHKYTELANTLRSRIRDGEYRPGQKLPSENELAAQTKYSRQTVRQAIGVLENEGLVGRVQGSGTFVRDGLLLRTPARNIAVVTTYIGEYIFPAILHGIEGMLSQNGYTAMLSATHNRVADERKILTELLKKPVDGLIVEGTKTAFPSPNMDLYEQFHRMGIPVVFFNGFYNGLKSPVYVTADDFGGGFMACEYLIKKGHSQIAGIFKSDDMQGHNRYAGYAEALRKHGLPVIDDHILWYTTENRDSLLQSCAVPVMAGCTAVVCYNDEIALRVIKLLNQNVVAVPEQMAVISFDNSTYARLSPVSITSLSNDKDKTGRLAAEKMLDILRHKKAAPSILPWTISEKAST